MITSTINNQINSNDIYKELSKLELPECDIRSILTLIKFKNASIHIKNNQYELLVKESYNNNKETIYTIEYFKRGD